MKFFTKLIPTHKSQNSLKNRYKEHELELMNTSVSEVLNVVVEAIYSKAKTLQYGENIIVSVSPYCVLINAKKVELPCKLNEALAKQICARLKQEGMKLSSSDALCNHYCF